MKGVTDIITKVRYESCSSDIFVIKIKMFIFMVQSSTSRFFMSSIMLISFMISYLIHFHSCHFRSEKAFWITIIAIFFSYYMWYIIFNEILELTVINSNSFSSSGIYIFSWKYCLQSLLNSKSNIYFIIQIFVCIAF